MGNGNHDDGNKRQYFKLVQLDRRICSRFVPRQSTNEQRHLLRLVNVGNVLSQSSAASADCVFRITGELWRWEHHASMERRF